MEKVKADGKAKFVIAHNLYLLLYSLNPGILRNIGISNFNVVQTEELLAKAKIKPVVNQVRVEQIVSLLE